MQDLIYYPSLEIYDEKWLKISLLYFKSIKPIIPYSNLSGLSDTFYYIQENTRFYDPLHPDASMDNILASQDAAELVKKIVLNPYEFDMIFKNVNIIREWQDQKNHNFKLYSGKYSHEWEETIKTLKIGTITDNFMMIDERLGQLYMTIFAHVLSDVSGIPLITDRNEIHRYSMLTRSRNLIGDMKKENVKINFTEKIIDLQIPVGIEKIPLKNIVELRNNSEFLENLTAYHLVISELQNLTNRDSAKQLIEKYQYTFNKYVDGLISAGFKLTKWGIKYFNPENVVKDAEDWFEASSTGYETYSILSNSWTKSKIRRHTKKYLLNIKELASP